MKKADQQKRTSLEQCCYRAGRMTSSFASVVVVVVVVGVPTHHVDVPINGSGITSRSNGRHVVGKSCPLFGAADIATRLDGGPRSFKKKGKLGSPKRVAREASNSGASFGEGG
jgi:hypothetical protein